MKRKHLTHRLALRLATALLLVAGLVGVPNTVEAIPAATDIVKTWDTRLTASGSSNTTRIALPLDPEGTYNFTVDWGDGLASTVDSPTDQDAVHTYASPGRYTTTITGTVRGWNFREATYQDATKLVEVSQWGNLKLGDYANSNVGRRGGYFKGTANMVVTATDALDLNDAPIMYQAFSGATLFNGDVSGWDTQHVTDMFAMFFNATSFNQDLGSWNVGNVTTMGSMFANASAFNQNISGWDTQNVTDMSYMFFGAAAFNQDISGWDTGEVTNMQRMFYSSSSFDQPIGTWDVSKVTNMSSMFGHASSFNQALGTWNTSAVTDMSLMFSNATSFNQALNQWDTSAVTNMSSMFSGASDFDGSVGMWNTSNVTTMAFMFNNASSFNQSIGTWNTSSATDMTQMFRSASAFDQDLTQWDTRNVTNTSAMFFNATSFNGDVSTWDVSNVTDTSWMFYKAQVFNRDLSSWDTSSVTDMQQMFHDAFAFSSDISRWNTANVLNMTAMFQSATSFNTDIATWDISNVTRIAYMFFGALAFNQDLSPWNTSSVTNMGRMFYNATAFDRNLGAWDIRSVVPGNQFAGLNGLFTGAGLSTENYGRTLTGWANGTQVPSGLTLDAGIITYPNSANGARSLLIAQYGWQITDGGAAPSVETPAQDPPPVVNAPTPDSPSAVETPSQDAQPALETPRQDMPSVSTTSAPTSMTYVPANKRVTLTWTDMPHAAHYTVKNAVGTTVCETPSNTCEVGGLRNGIVTTYTVTAYNHGNVAATETTSVKAAAGFLLGKSTAQVRQRIALEKFVSTTSKGAKAWRITNGGCRISGKQLVMPNRRGRCTLELAVGRHAAYPKMSVKVIVAVSRK